MISFATYLEEDEVIERTEVGQGGPGENVCSLLVSM